MKTSRIAIVAAAVLFFTTVAPCFTSVAQAQISITDGTSSYTWNMATGAANFNDTNNGDGLVEEFWVVRFEDGNAIGDGTQVETLTSAADVFSFSNNGDRATASFGYFSAWDNVNPLFTYTIDFRISTGADGDARLQYDFTADYVFGGGMNDGLGELDVFHYFDVAMEGAGGDDINVNVNGTGMVFESQNGLLGYHNAGTATRFEIQNKGANNIDDRINTTYNLTNSPTILSSVDITAAYQWDFNVATVGEQFTANNVFAIPEPGSLGLLAVLGFAGFGFCRRRKK